MNKILLMGFWMTLKRYFADSFGCLRDTNVATLDIFWFALLFAIAINNYTIFLVHIEKGVKLGEPFGLLFQLALLRKRHVDFCVSLVCHGDI